MYGDLGVSPGSAVTGSPSVGPPGTIHAGDAHAAAAQFDNTAAFTYLDQGCDVTYGGVQDLTLVSPLVPGVYCAVSFGLSGTLALSGSGVWIFKSSATLITSPSSSVTGGDACNVWWRVGSSATLGTNTVFRGNILASTSIGLNSGASLNGRALAQTGAVTLANSTISGCIQSDRDRDAGVPGDLCGRFPLRAGRGRRASVGCGADRHPTARPGHTKGCAISTAGGRQVMRVSI